MASNFVPYLNMASFSKLTNILLTSSGNHKQPCQLFQIHLRYNDVHFRFIAVESSFVYFNAFFVNTYEPKCSYRRIHRCCLVLSMYILLQVSLFNL